VSLLNKKKNNIKAHKKKRKKMLNYTVQVKKQRKGAHDKSNSA
jgi:uncharacterized protein (DUF927 family)